MSITAIQRDIIEEFSMFEDWMERYEYMIELGKSLPLIDSKLKTEKKGAPSSSALRVGPRHFPFDRENGWI